MNAFFPDMGIFSFQKALFPTKVDKRTYGVGEESIVLESAADSLKLLRN